MDERDQLLLEIATLGCADGTRERLYREKLGLSWTQATQQLLRVIYDPAAIVAEPRRTRVLAEALEHRMRQKKAWLDERERAWFEEPHLSARVASFAVQLEGMTVQ